MMKAACEIIRCRHRSGVSQKSGKPYDGYDVCVNLEGYQYPFTDFIFTNTLNGVELKEGMKGIVYLDINNNMHPSIGYHFG